MGHIVNNSVAFRALLPVLFKSRLLKSLSPANSAVGSLWQWHFRGSTWQKTWLMRGSTNPGVRSCGWCLVSVTLNFDVLLPVNSNNIKEHNFRILVRGLWSGYRKRSWNTKHDGCFYKSYFWVLGTYYFQGNYSQSYRQKKNNYKKLDNKLSYFLSPWMVNSHRIIRSK